MATQKQNVLVLDWSNLMYRSLFIAQLYGGVTTMKSSAEMNSYISNFAKDVCSIVNIFHANNVIIAADSKNPWRNEIMADLGGYKSTRNKDLNIDMDNVYSCSDKLLEIFKGIGFHIAKTDNAEADDLIALVKENVFEHFPDSNVIIVSADADVRQLMEFNNDTHQFCIVYNSVANPNSKVRHLYVPKAFNEWLVQKNKNPFALGSAIDTSKMYIQNFLSSNKDVDIVDTVVASDILLNKIFCGDDGDNVPAFYSWYKNGKKVRITPKKEQKIRETLNINSLDSLLMNVGNLKEVFESVCKRDSIDDIDFAERVDRQRHLVELNSELFPKSISSYTDAIYEMLNMPQQTSMYPINYKTMLEGTEFKTSDKRYIEADVFKDMDKYIFTRDKGKLF